MASAVNNLQKIIRHHIPLIRFKYGVNRSGKMQHESVEEKDNTSINSTGASSSSSKVGYKSDTLEFFQTPQKYRRRPLTQEEIDLVMIGGFS